MKQGLLKRCLPKLGLVQFKGQVYGFAHPSSLEAFAAEPDTCVASVDRLVARQPVLARVLNRAAAFPALDLQLVLNVLSAPLKVGVIRSRTGVFAWGYWESQGCGCVQAARCFCASLPGTTQARSNAMV